MEAREMIEKYRFDLREYEDENEELVKRASEDRMKVMQAEAENLQVFSFSIVRISLCLAVETVFICKMVLAL